MWIVQKSVRKRKVFSVYSLHCGVRCKVKRQQDCLNIKEKQRIVMFRINPSLTLIKLGTHSTQSLKPLDNLIKL